MVDGRLGEFTRKAMVNYRQAKSLPADWMPDTGNIAGHTVYRITSKDLSLIGANAEEPGDQAKQSKMPYTTPIEVLCERFHTTQKYLRSLNPGIDINSAPPGASITVPNVSRPFDYHAYPSSYRPPSSATAHPARIFGKREIRSRCMGSLKGEGSRSAQIRSCSAASVLNDFGALLLQACFSTP